MKRLSRPRKAPSSLPNSIHQRLNMYALAAGAAGVSVMAMAAPSEAEIVYTPANVTITDQSGDLYYLDLNGDGINDFVFGGNTRTPWFYVRGLHGDAAADFPTYGSSSCSATALKAGQIIGSRNHFCSNPFFLGFADMVLNDAGKWVDVSRRYLGFKFAAAAGPTMGGHDSAFESTESLLRQVSPAMLMKPFRTIPSKPVLRVEWMAVRQMRMSRTLAQLAR